MVWSLSAVFSCRLWEDVYCGDIQEGASREQHGNPRPIDARKNLFATL